MPEPQTLPEILHTPPLSLFVAAWFFLLGACWGSFLNVVIYRFPREMSVVRPRSHCFSCGKPLSWRDNIPVLGWLILRGKARCCGAPFSPRYAIVEALTGALFVVAWLQLPPAVALVAFVFISLMVAGAFIDYDTQFLPDFVTIGGAAGGLVLAVLVPALHGHGDPQLPYVVAALRSALDAIVGMAVGSGILLWLAMFAGKLLRKDAMGEGDVYLLGCIGAFCGWQGALFAIFGGALIGAAATALLVLVNALTGQRLTPGKTSKADPAPDNANSAPDTVKSVPDNTVTASPETTAPAVTTEAREGESGAEADHPATASAEEPEVPSLGFGVQIPFGPWLAAGGLAYLLGASEFVDAYLANAAAIFFNAW